MLYHIYAEIIYKYSSPSANLRSQISELTELTIDGTTNAISAVSVVSPLVLLSDISGRSCSRSMVMLGGAVKAVVTVVVVTAAGGVVARLFDDGAFSGSVLS